MRIFETFFEESYSLLIFFGSYKFFSKLNACSLVLGGHFAFTTLPWMEDMVVELRHSQTVITGLIEKCDFLKHKVVAHGDETGIFLQESEACCVVASEPLVELVELHEYTRIGIVEAESFFHCFDGFSFVVALVEVTEGKIAPCGGIVGIDTCSRFPVGHGDIVLTFVVVEIAEEVVCVGVSGVESYSCIEGDYSLQTIGEDVVGARRSAFVESFLRGFGVSGHKFAPTHVVVCHGGYGA